MSEPIKVGDLAQVIHECCAPGKVIGHVGRVLELSPGFFECEDCGHQDRGVHARVEGMSSTPDDAFESMGWVPAQWLKRIPPAGELGIVDEKRDAEITA